MKNYFIYIMASPNNKVIYTGVTNDLIRRVYVHKSKMVNGFTKRYNVVNLIYYEMTNDIIAAIAREKQIKSYSRKKKNELINSTNPKWDDLYGKLI
jgi:putative endonuclease